jgi:hypothetical protein
VEDRRRDGEARHGGVEGPRSGGPSVKRSARLHRRRRQGQVTLLRVLREGVSTYGESAVAMHLVNLLLPHPRWSE